MAKNPLAQHSEKFQFDAAPVRFWSISVDKMRTKNYGGGKTSDPMYYAEVIIPNDHPELKGLQALMAKIAKAAFPGIPFNDISFPLRRGDEVADEAAKNGKDYAFLRGQVLMNTDSKQYPPNLGILVGGGVVDVTEDVRPTIGGKFYSGVRGTCEINLVPYAGNKNVPNSIHAYLTAAVSLGVGQNLGGGSAASKFGNFARNIGTVSQENVTVGMDDNDEIPF